MVRLRAGTGEVVGSGFLVEAGHVVTCAHVVARALGRNSQETPTETDVVVLDFPLVAAGIMVRAQVAEWHPIQDDDKGDVAVLLLMEEPPAGSYPVSLVAVDDLWSHPFRTFGFPRHHDHGVWAAGILRARQAAGWVQMECGPSGYSVEAGFSGAAVWDDEVAGIVGMTVATDAHGDLRAAYLIPADVLVRAWPRLTARTLPPCPYRGLYPFRERDVGVFFGRQDLTDRLVTEVGRRPLVAIVGPSGSGKSSVVFAGLIPRILRKEGWMSISMRPAQASSPLFALAAALLPVLDPDQAETDRLTALGQLATLLRDGRLPEVVERVLARAGMTHLLLVVDQFEELFARQGDNASEFTVVLLAALRAGQGVSPRGLTVVVTLRADFLGQALQDPALAVALEGAVTTIGQMGRDQLRAVIKEPLPPGVSYEAGLVERVLGDVGEESGSLPLLEFALTLLWERQDQGKLTHAAYEQLGGVDGALASYAERVYLEQLRPEDQEEVRRLLIQLVRPSDVGEPVRRVARRPELSEPRWQLGQRLAATRLLVADRDPTGVESVELVHEALIAGWSRLYEWVDEDRAFRIWQERLRGAAAEWETVRCDPGALLRGAPLAEAERWLAERPDDIGDPERQFIQASRTLRDRSVRRLRVAVVSLTLLLVLALSLGAVAVWQFNRADNQSRLAQSRALVTRANSLSESQPDVAMLLAAAAYKIEDTAEAIEALTRMASQHRHVDKLLVTEAVGGSEIVFSPTDPDVVALTYSNGIALLDVKKNVLVQRIEVDVAGTPAFSPDGRALAFIQVRGEEQTLSIWFHAENQMREISRIGSESGVDFSSRSLVFSPDGGLLGTCVGPVIQLWTVDPPSPRQPIPLGRDSECGFGFTADSRVIAYTDGVEIVMWDIFEGRVTARNRPPLSPDPFPDPSDPSLKSFTVAPDGRMAVFQDLDTKLVWWDLDRQDLLPGIELPSLGSPVSISFTPDSRFAAIERQGGVLLIDVIKRIPTGIYSANGYRAGGLSSDRSLIAVGAGRNVIALTEIRAHEVIPVGQVIYFAVQPDGRHVTTVSYSGEVAIHSFENPGRVIIIPAVDNELTSSVVETLSSNGLKYAVVGDSGYHIRLREVSSSPAPEVILGGHRSEVLQLSFDPNSEFLVSADKSEAIVWSVRDQVEISRMPLPNGYVMEILGVGPGGRYVAAATSDGKIFVWDTASNNPTPTLLPIDGGMSFSFSPDGSWLSIGNLSEIRLWDLKKGEIDPRRLPISGTQTSVSGVQKIEFSSDGTLLATFHSSDFLRGVTVWEIRDAQIVGTVFGNTYNRLNDFEFAPDGARIAVAGDGILLVSFDAPSALRHVCRITGRNLTQEEWNQHAQGFDYIATCP